ncbi:MAG: pirin family protein [Acidobacteria bacterium]|nr:MAG: pirin family protein [Acidobacteriota bacterium]REK05938.1 MAG: pirin family protein [Acidobacteriota bacterium]
MSWNQCPDPDLEVVRDAPVETVILPRARDLGEFEVRRALPSKEKQMIGPFIFFDQMGPAEFLVGRGMDVRPHPHIGLSTVTYLFRGQIQHRDSLGTLEVIRPGELNWMTSGQGIVHSERTPREDRAEGPDLFGIQAWVALPRDAEDTRPAFEHYGRERLPEIVEPGATVRLIAGALYGETSPVRCHSDMFYAEVVLADGARIPLAPDYDERGVYVVEGAVEIAGDVYEAGRLVVLRPGDEVTLRSRGASRCMFLGGEPMDGPRYLWWNFVASTRDRIEQAKNDWKLGRFAKVPGDSEEFIPLPEDDARLRRPPSEQPAAE